jgi:hypothetical protein
MLNNAITHSVEVIIVRYTVLAYQPALHIAVAQGSREMVVRSALLKSISTCTEVVLYLCTLICGISLKIVSLYLKKKSVSTTCLHHNSCHIPRNRRNRLQSIASSSLSTFRDLALLLRSCTRTASIHEICRLQQEEYLPLDSPPSSLQRDSSVGQLIVECGKTSL